MIDKNALGILIILLSAPYGLGQQYYPTDVQQDAPGGAYFQPLPPNSLEASGFGQYATSYASTYAATPPQFAPPQANVPVPYAAPYATPYAATPQFAPAQANVPVPYATPYAAPYTAPYTAPYATTPYATTPPQLPTPSLPPLIDTPTPPAANLGDAESGTPEEIAEKAIDEPMLVEVEPTKAWYYAPVDWFDLWEGNVEMGLSGSDGNSQTLNYLLGLDAKRETDEHILGFDLKYDRKTANSVDTAHRLFAEARWELLFEDSCWTWFFHETTEYDEFKAFDVRLSYDTGLGRSLIKNDNTSLSARAAAGMSHEIGGLSDEMVPEGVFGLEFEHKLNERQKLSASSEYSPDVTDFLDYRLKSRASWEVLLDEDTNLSLKMSILNRYDSTPSGKKANDLDYTLTLLWSF